MSTTYGIISDIHQNALIRAGPDKTIEVFKPALHALVQEEAQAPVLNGDLVGSFPDQQSQANYMAALLQESAQTGLPVYVLPGSHDTVPIFEAVMNAMTSKHSNIIDTTKADRQKFELGDHHLVFLPGSDSHAGPASQMGYNLEERSRLDPAYNAPKDMKVTHINDLRTLLTDPDKTIIFSHVPRRFNTVLSVDYATFGKAREPFNLNGDYIPAKVIFPVEAAKELEKLGAPIDIMNENFGNEALSEIYKSLGVRFNITGHIHESVGNATDAEGLKVEEGLYVPSLFWNASCLDQGIVGLLSVDDGKVAFENIDIRAYFNR
ncbi:metallophosphoesterase [Candidatus Woesearchaeota archaeon]|nr:metallophosphoesterase [Candidatus Woesearchaeota archaeon]